MNPTLGSASGTVDMEEPSAEAAVVPMQVDNEAETSSRSSQQPTAASSSSSSCPNPLLVSLEVGEGQPPQGLPGVFQPGQFKIVTSATVPDAQGDSSSVSAIQQHLRQRKRDFRERLVMSFGSIEQLASSSEGTPRTAASFNSTETQLVPIPSTSQQSRVDDSGWQESRLLLTERASYLMNNPRMSDVKFLVGENKIEIFGHKTILAMGSPVFEAQFYGSVGSDVETIELPDLEPETFLLFLKVGDCVLFCIRITDCFC
jgi:hypothetical protein